MDERPAKRARLQINLDLHLVDQDSGCSITIDRGETNSSHRAIGNDEVATVDTSASNGQQRSGIADASQQRPIASVTQSCGINVLSQNGGDTATSRLAPAVATMEQSQAQGVNGNLVRGPKQSNGLGLLAQPNGRNDTLDNGQPAPAHANALVPSPNPWTAAAQQVSSYMQRSGLRNMEQALDRLDEPRFRRILLQHASHSPYVATSILANYEEVLQAQTHREQQPVIDFGPFGKQVWHAMNTRYRDWHAWEKLDIVADVELEVERVIDKGIMRKIKPYSQFSTKKSALETLRKIGKTLFLSTSVIADEMRSEDGLVVKALVPAMAKVVDRMTREERVSMAALDDPDFVTQLAELMGMARPRSLVTGIYKVLVSIRDAGEETPISSEDGETSDEDDQDRESLY